MIHTNEREINPLGEICFSLFKNRKALKLPYDFWSNHHPKDLKVTQKRKEWDQPPTLLPETGAVAAAAKHARATLGDISKPPPPTPTSQKSELRYRKKQDNQKVITGMPFSIKTISHFNERCCRFLFSHPSFHVNCKQEEFHYNELFLLEGAGKYWEVELQHLA